MGHPKMPTVISKGTTPLLVTSIPAYHIAGCKQGQCADWSFSANLDQGCPTCNFSTRNSQSLYALQSNSSACFHCFGFQST